MKQWILNTFFANELAEAKKQGAIESFKTAHQDILTTMQDDLDYRAEELAKEKLSKMLTSVDLTHIVKYDRTGKIIFIGDERAEAGQLGNLKSEAEFFGESNLWKILTETPRQLAQDALFEKGDTLDSMVKGRAMLYTISTQENILNTFRSLSTQKVDK